MKAGDREFLLGIVWSAWWSNRGHHDEQIAADLLLQSGASIAALQRLARAQDYAFTRGFWASVRRKAERL